MSYCYLSNIDVSYFELCASDKFSITMIDDLCDQIVTSLNASANQCVPRVAG